MVTTQSSSRSYTALTFILILSLAFHFVLRKIHAGHYIAFDNAQMASALRSSCDGSFVELINPLWACYADFTGALYQIPFLYLSAMLAIEFGKFFLIFKLYQALDSKKSEKDYAIAVAAFAMLFVLVAGGGRFLIASYSILWQADLAYKSFAQLLLMASLFAFFKRRYALSAWILLPPALLLQPLNSANLIAILGLAFLFIEWRGRYLARLPIYLLPIALTIAVQVFLQNPLEIHSSWFRDLPETSLSIQQWYAYLLHLDANDISILWHIRELPFIFVGYLVVCGFGLFFAWKLEGQNTFGDFVKRPGPAVAIAGLIYVLVCGAVEYLQSPSVLLEAIIILAPKRVMWLPALIASYYIVKFVLDFFLVTERTTLEHYRSISLFLLIFSGLLFFGTWESVGVSGIVGLTIFGLLFLVTTLFFILRDSKLVSHSRKMLLAAVLPLLLVAVTARTLPYISSKTLSDFDALFLDINHRTYQDYLVINGELSGDFGPARDLIALAKAIDQRTPQNSTVLAIFAAAGEDRYALESLTGRMIRAATPEASMRGQLYTLYEYFQQLWPRFSDLTGLGFEEYVALTDSEATGRMDKKYLGYLQSYLDQTANGVVPEPIWTLVGRKADFVFVTRDYCNKLNTRDLTIYENDSYCLFNTL
jgi:hypothetical protein